MKKNLKKTIFIIFCIWWIFQIIGDVFQRDSVTSNIWTQYNFMWLLYLICFVTIILTLYSALLYIQEEKPDAYKFLFISFAVYLVEGILETIFVSLISKETLINWVTINRQDRGLPLQGIPTVVDSLIWGYLLGIILYAVIMYLIYRHWQKLKMQLQMKTNSAVLKKRRKIK